MMIFLRVGWMDRYQGLGSGDTITGGGSHVAEYGYGHEIFNFRPWDGRVYGYVQPPGAAHNTESDRTVNITRLGASKEDPAVAGVLAIWVATRPGGGMVVVGWYRNATVYRNWQPPPIGSDRNYAGSDFGYFVTAAAKDATLLPVDERLLSIPKGKGGMGQSNIWYADDGSQGEFLKAVETLVSTRRLPASTNGNGPVRQTNPYLRQQVERVAVAETVAYYTGLGYQVDSVEKDNKGWDLDADHPRLGSSLKLEVKGLAGRDVCVDVTPNEYARMLEHRDAYRLCVVTSALHSPHLSIFSFSPDSETWRDQAGRVLEINEIIAARCRAQAE